METLNFWLNSLVNTNKRDFARWPEIKWLNPYNSVDYQLIRDQFLEKIDENVLFRNTKPYHHQISRGCSMCGQGKWSCLFITNKCNAACFYCPAIQHHDELPSSQGLDFERPSDYAEYVHFFGFEGVSFSGGEPLLFFERTRDYLREVRKKCNSNLYIWMYTNGILADKKGLQKLANEGLNEIRFDIGATSYSLDKVKQAKGTIPNLTIEIPAVPEEKERLKRMLPQIVKAGVTNLNLHQLRLTPHNANQLIKRGYTFINAEKPIVLESELMALEIIDYAQNTGMELGINYCSFHFKNRFQKAGYRKRITGILSPGASITENGYIREYSGDSIAYKCLRLYYHKPSFIHTNELQLKDKKYYYAEEIMLKKTILSENDRKNIQALIESEPEYIPDDPLLFKIWQFEYIEKGLRPYF